MYLRFIFDILNILLCMSIADFPEELDKKFPEFTPHYISK